MAQWFLKDFKGRQCIFSISLLSPLGKGRDSAFEQMWIPFIQGCFVRSFVEIGPVVLGNFFLKISTHFHCVAIISPWKRASLHLRIHYVKLGWIWSSGSGEDENVKILKTNRQTTDDRRPESSLSRPFSSNELNKWYSSIRDFKHPLYVFQF